MRIVRVFRDIRNWLHMRKTVKENCNTIEWNKFNLRYNWFYMIGTVITLKKEYFGEPEEVRKMRFMEHSKFIFDYLTELQLGEIVAPEIKYLDGTYSYLVKFPMIWTGLTAGYILTRLFLIGLFCYFFSDIYNSIEFLINYIKGLF